MYNQGFQNNPAESVKSVQFYERGVEEVSGAAMAKLARLLKEGAEDVDRDPTRAVQLYQRAIDKGEDVSVILELADLPKDGAEGLDADPARAMQLYERAFEESAYTGLIANFSRLKADPARVLRLFERAEEDADAYTMWYLANQLKDGAKGLHPNPARAVQLYERAIVEHEYTFSMMDLADLLKHGAEGVKADRARAVRLYERAIDQDTEGYAMIRFAGFCTTMLKGALQERLNYMSPPSTSLEIRRR